MCVYRNTHTHTRKHLPSHHKPPYPTLSFSLYLSVFVSVGCSSNLPLSPSLFVDLRMDASPSKLDYCPQSCLAWISPRLGVIPHGSLTREVITWFSLSLSIVLAICVWVNGRFKVQVFAALRTSLKISGWINSLHFCIYRKYRVAPGLKIAKITGKQFSSYQLMHLLCLLAGCEFSLDSFLEVTGDKVSFFFTTLKFA